MKKILAILLSCILCIGIVGCGDKSEEKKGKEITAVDGELIASGEIYDVLKSVHKNIELNFSIGTTEKERDMKVLIKLEKKEKTPKKLSDEFNSICKKMIDKSNDTLKEYINLNDITFECMVDDGEKYSPFIFVEKSKPDKFELGLLTTEDDFKESNVDTNKKGKEDKPIVRKNLVGKSNKDFKELSKNAPTKVRNDVTGNWRLEKISKSCNIQEYALSYYKENFISDEEIHAIVNFATNTTTKISDMGDFIEVVVLEYVPKEEHDAKKLFGGMKLGHYWIYKDNGDIEKI